MYKGLLAIALGTVVFCALGSAADAGERRARATAYADASEHPRYRHYRKRGTRVYGYAARRGGYSYEYGDVVNTYGQSRSLFGGLNSYRDTFADRQTPSGPFDHGFFFDSGVAPRGGDSPYPH